MREIKYVVVHCSATRPGQRVTVADIDRWHRERGFKKIGYHYVIDESGRLHKGRELSEVGAHVSGYNTNSIGVCYIGGLDAAGDPCDTRTPDQKAALFFILQQLKEQFPGAVIQGHRDFSPDRNGNGIIEQWEFVKACPCFDAKTEYLNI